VQNELSKTARATPEKPIPLHLPFRAGREVEYISQALAGGSLVGDGEFTRRCRNLLEARLDTGPVLLTTSCTSALEMAAILCKGESEPGEVIVPGFTFVSTANAFVLHGYRPVFVDIRESDCNVDPRSIEAAITPQTRVIVPVHYAGVPCEMDTIMEIANRHNLYVVEDAAQALYSRFGSRYAGTIGHLGTLSFHDTKNLGCGEGGALIINDQAFAERGEYIREKGTNRSRFLKGVIDKYTWVDVGGSYLPSELQSAFLLAQLEKADWIHERRIFIHSKYLEMLAPLEAKGFLRLPAVAPPAFTNAHVFHVLVDNEEQRDDMIAYLKRSGVGAAFHYLPLHLSPYGQRYGQGPGSLPVVERVAGRLLRLPIYPQLSEEEVEHVVHVVTDYFRKGRSGRAR
jgi:dTDP-4-amino-4,6-dideoxygalactose transaminase